MNFLLTLSLFFQEGSPEQVLKKLEDRVEAAKTLRVTFSIDFTSFTGERQENRKSSTGAGTLLVSKAGKVRLELRTPGEGKEKPDTFLWLYDGTRLRIRRRNDPIEETAPPENLKAFLLSIWVRGGYGNCAVLLSWLNVKDRGPQEIKGLLKAKEFQWVRGKPEEGLKFTFTPFNTPQDTAKTIIWWDLKTLEMKKRETRQDLPGLGKFVETETYEEFRLDGEVSEDLFIWPGEK